MLDWDLGQLARAAGSEVCGGALPKSVAAVGTDSRSLPSACLFVALRGPRYDGHAYVRAAVAGGALAVMIDRQGNVGLDDLAVPRLVVDDTLRGLGDMAHAVRTSLKKPVLAVTGSNGKTTTKEMLAAILAERGPVHRTQGNLNNLIGVPLTIFAWPSATWSAVLEMGMNVPGEIERLTEIAVPNVGVVTMVGPAHLEGLGSVEAVARAKGELYAMLPSDGTAVVNIDDEVINSVAAPLIGARRRLSFGRKAGADVRVVSHTPDPTGQRLTFEIAGKSVELHLPLVGAHNAMNAAAAAASAWAVGTTREAIAAGLGKVSVPGGRLRLVRADSRGVQVIDDTYNANPASMRAAFATLAELGKSGRRIAVLGDMFELGATAPALHREIGRAAADAGVTLVLALGALASEVALGAQSGRVEARPFSELEPLLQDLESELRPNDVVLVKGSRGMKMERVVQHLLGAKA